MIPRHWNGILCLSVGILLGAGRAFGADATIDLWPEGRMPSVQTNQAAPLLRWYEPRQRTTDAVLIAVSGGGYGGEQHHKF